MPEGFDIRPIHKKYVPKIKKVRNWGGIVALSGIAIAGASIYIDVNHTNSFLDNPEVIEYKDVRERLSNLETPISKAESAVESLEGISSRIVDSGQARDLIIQPLYDERARLAHRVENLRDIPVVKDYIQAKSFDFSDLAGLVLGLGLVYIGFKGAEIAESVISERESREIADYLRQF